jgi:RNA polymerase sigma-70 factor (ECF subfamily)
MQDQELITGLRRGDSEAFAGLVDEMSSSLLRVALMYVPSREVAEEVVQDTWIGVIQGIDRFEGRSSLRTWIYRILTNTAKTRGGRERRSLPFSAVAGAGPEDGSEPSVDPDRFLPDDHERWPGHWSRGPTAWRTPEDGLLGKESCAIVLKAVEELPPVQREVITLRDIEGWDAAEVCDALGVSAGNQRVLLHRARSKVRAAIDRYQDGVLEPVA